MLKFPLATHRLHFFEFEGRLYVADLDSYGKTLEIDPLIAEILRICPCLPEEQILAQLKGRYTPEEILQAFAELEEIEKAGMLFSSFVEPVLEVSSPKRRPKIFIPQTGGDWFSDISQIAAGTNVALFHILEALAKYADIHVTGKEAKKITDGIYQVPFDFSPQMLRSFSFQDYYGILACPARDSSDLLPLFSFADVPVVIQNYAPRGHGGDAINLFLLYHSAMRDFDAFIAPSDSVARFYSRFVSDVSLFYTIPLGVDLNLFKPMEKHAAKQQVATLVQDTRLLEKPVVGFLSRFMPEKGASLFLQLAVRNPDILFLVAAKSLTTYSLRNLPKNVIYAGFHPRERLPLLYNAFDVYCFLSMSGEETFGLTVLEAMACGVPPIVPDFDGVPEVVGDAGIIVEAEDFAVDLGSFASSIFPTSLDEKVNFLLRNSEERSRLGKKARERALGFTWDETAKKLLALFEALHRKKALTKRGNLSVLFAKDFSHDGNLKGKSLLLNVNEREENPLMRGAYPQSVEEGLALTLLKSHSSRELEALLLSLTKDKAKALNIINRAKGFANAVY